MITRKLYGFIIYSKLSDKLAEPQECKLSQLSNY